MNHVPHILHTQGNIISVCLDRTSWSFPRRVRYNQQDFGTIIRVTGTRAHTANQKQFGNRSKQSRCVCIVYTHDNFQGQRSGAVSESRWTSWVLVPNKPTVSVDVKQHFNQPTNFIFRTESRSCVKVEVNVLGSRPVPNSPYGSCGSKATFEEEVPVEEMGRPQGTVDPEKTTAMSRCRWLGLMLCA